MSSPRKHAAGPPRVASRSISVLVLRVSIRDLSPSVWREISVPATYSLAQLHRVIQCAFCWMDYHLHGFRMGRKRFVPAGSELPGIDTETTTLASLKLKPGSSFVYDYDYGDGWEHDIEVVSASTETVAPFAVLMPRVLGGERAAPPEDSGGAPGYEALLVALADPTHEGHVQARLWVPRGFAPVGVDLPSADHALVLACAWGAI